MSATLVSNRSFVAGWLDSSIHEFLRALPPGGAATKYALITCLDSNPTPAKLRHTSPELRPIAKESAVLGRGLLVRTDALLHAERQQQIFFGFDEIWFFPNKSIQPKPDVASLVGPSRVTQSGLNKLGKWMTANSCSMGLGGGEGLNFIVRAQGLSRFLLGYTIQQPETSGVS